MLAMDLAPEHAQTGQDLQKAKQDLPLEQLEEASLLKLSCMFLPHTHTHTRYVLGNRADMCVNMLFG